MMKLFLILMLVKTSYEDTVVITKTLKEELSVGTFVLDLKKETNLMNTSSNDFQWVAKEEFEQYFSLENGIIRINKRLDREQMCPGLVECLKRIRVMSKKTMLLITIDFSIEDINDNSPIFNISDMKTNISESAQLGVFYQLHPAEDLDSP
ncbi:hypothetical protein HELRODRAFT_145840, partial [Helobdella robusta]|uniref:Cadherin domain-containing protein n=1 Tax=Helobdella robusta TaxID=6412 RepID=T1EJN2_HELRO